MKRSIQTRMLGYLGRAFALSWLLFIAGCTVTGSSASQNKLSKSTRVLMIGDSLTVGPFGGQVQSWLVSNLGAHRVFVYGSCGSSPEHWVAANPSFVSPCGYREKTPTSSRVEVHRNGRRPAQVAAPKVEQLIAKHRPEVVIVQLGTNHFDTLTKKGMSAVPQLEANYDEFSRALRGAGSSVRLVIWVTPPDSTKYTAAVENKITELIVKNNKKHKYGTIVSKTKYVPGDSGSDGVHYNDKGAAPWSAQVINKLDQTFKHYGVK